MMNSQFHIVGINYKKTDLNSRGRFSFSKEQYESICKGVLPSSFHEFFILSTCNRTEIYAITSSSTEIFNWLHSNCKHVADLRHEMYVKSGKEAEKHLLEVASGLDSQMLGDYEITGQIKQAFKIAKEYKRTGPFMERLINTALQCAKQVRNKTLLSSGTISVAFAAIQYLKQHADSLRNKKILIAGTGKIGRNTCKNLIDYTQARDITLINRTADHAQDLSALYQLKNSPWSALPEAVKASDIIIVATQSATPIITKEMILPGTSKILIDLSVPVNIDPALANQEEIWLMNVDMLSKINDETLSIRQAAIPEAEAIIEAHHNEFKDWLSYRKNVPVIQATRLRLETMHACPMFQKTVIDMRQPESKKIQQVVNNMAAEMRVKTAPGCFFIQAINEYITLIA